MQSPICSAYAQPLPILTPAKVRQKEVIALAMLDFLLDAIGEEKFAGLKSVLEFGCSTTGFLPYYMAGKKAYGVDLHEAYADHWAKRGVRYLVSDGREIPLPDRSIYLVVCHSVAEHIPDLRQSLGEIDRILKPGGIAFITASPLYFSPRGHHKASLEDWEHLRPGSRHYMIEQPIGGSGACLNRLTMSQFMALVGELPWNIVKMDRRILPAKIPQWLEGSFPKLDLLTRGFRMVARKV